MRAKIEKPRKKGCNQSGCLMLSKKKRGMHGTQYWQDDDERRRRKFSHALGFFGNKKTPKPQMSKKQCKKKSRCDPKKKKLDWLPLVGAGAKMAVMDSYNMNRVSKLLEPERGINY